MRKSIVFGLVVLVMLLSVTGVFAQTTSSSTPEAEAEVQGELPLLEPGVPVEDAFVGDAGARLYGFYGSEGDVVTLTLTQITDDLDPFLIVLGPRGEVIASDDDSGEVLLSSAVEDVELPFDGSYLVIVTSLVGLRSATGSDSDGEYVLTLEGSTPAVDDPNYSPDSFFLYYGQLEDGVPVEGVTNTQEPVFYYVFNAEEGDTLNITIDESDFDNLMYLFDAAGNRIAVDDDSNVLNAEIDDFTAPQTGIYFLMVTDAFFSVEELRDGEDFGGTFTLSLNID